MSAKKVQPRRLKGFQDYDPQTMAKRYEIMDAVRQEAQLAGFQAIGTPALEYAEVLLGVGGETDKQVFRFVDNGDRDVAMRFDLTVPFARYVAENQGSLVFPFKRLQIGDVWRAEKPQKGRYREFCQCDLDIIGVNSLEADTEILVGFHNILRQVAPGPYTMALGHRHILTAMLRRCLGPLGDEGEQEAFIIIDKWKKIGEEQVAILLAGLAGGAREGVDALLGALAYRPGQGSDLREVAALLADDKEALQELAQFEACLALTQELSADGAGTTLADLSIARGLGYYTGIVFETTLDELPGFGSICSGGRYNRLVERYLSRELPGIGGSLGLDRLLGALVELGRLGASQAAATVFVALATDDAKTYGFRLAQNLRRHGIACDIALKTPKLSQQFKHAHRLGYPYVLTVGSEEAQSATVRIKEMATGEEEVGVPFAQILAKVEQKLASARSR